MRETRSWVFIVCTQELTNSIHVSAAKPYEYVEAPSCYVYMKLHSCIREIPCSLSYKGAKLIDLEMNLDNSKFILLVGVSPKIDDRYSICVQLHPAYGSTYLPPQIKLTLLSSQGETLLESISRSYDHYLINTLQNLIFFTFNIYF